MNKHSSISYADIFGICFPIYCSIGLAAYCLTATPQMEALFINLSFGFFRVLGCVKASGIENPKQVNIKNINLLGIYRSARAFTLAENVKKTKTQVIRHSCICLALCEGNPFSSTWKG